MPRSIDRQNTSNRINWTNQPHYQMHGGPKNRSGFRFKRGWVISVLRKSESLKIRYKNPQIRTDEFVGTTIQDLVIKGGIIKGRNGWGSTLANRSWLTSRTDKFLYRGMHVGTPADDQTQLDEQQQIVRNIGCIGNLDHDPDAGPERRKQYAEARKFFLEEGGLKVSVSRTMTGGHWNPFRWRRGLRGGVRVNRWRAEREANVATLARQTIREATIAAYAKTDSVEFAKHVKEQMLAALLEKKDGKRELDKLFQCAEEAHWEKPNSWLSWKSRKNEDFAAKYHEDKREAAPTFFDIHDAIIDGEPADLKKVVQDGADHTLNIIDKVADPSYYQMHGDPQGQNRYRVKAGWAKTDLGQAMKPKAYNTFLKKKRPEHFLKGTRNFVFFEGNRWPDLKLSTNKYLYQDMEVGTDDDAERIKKNLDGILSGGWNLNSDIAPVSEEQVELDVAARKFFIEQGGLNISVRRTMTGGHWNPFKWRRGLRDESHINYHRVAREAIVADSARKAISEATIAAYVKTDSIEFAKHVKEQMLAALLEKKMDGRPLDKLFECSKNAYWEKPKSWLSWKKSDDQRFWDKYRTESREAAPEFYEIYDAVTYGKPNELRRVAQSASEMKYDNDPNQIILVRKQSGSQFDGSNDSFYDGKIREEHDEKISVLDEDLARGKTKNNKRKSQKNIGRRKRAPSSSSRNNSDVLIVEEQQRPKKKKNALLNEDKASLNKDTADLAHPENTPPADNNPDNGPKPANTPGPQQVGNEQVGNEQIGNAKHELKEDENDQIQTIGINLSVDSETEINFNDPNKNFVTIETDDSDGEKSRASDTQFSKRSSDAAIPKMTQLRDRIGEPSKTLSNHNNNNNDNNNNNSIESAENAEDYNKAEDQNKNDKDGL